MLSPASATAGLPFRPATAAAPPRAPARASAHIPAATSLLRRTKETRGNVFCCCSRLSSAMEAKQTHLPRDPGSFKM